MAHYAWTEKNPEFLTAKQLKLQLLPKRSMAFAFDIIQWEQLKICTFRNIAYIWRNNVTGNASIVHILFFKKLTGHKDAQGRRTFELLEQTRNDFQSPCCLVRRALS